MTRRDSGPPDTAGPAAKPGPTAITASSYHTASIRDSRRHIGPYARAWRRRAGPELWREGYRYGFLGALTAVAREVNDPYVWAALSRIGETFTLADAHTLVGGE
jgi:hypothetical protein